VNESERKLGIIRAWMASRNLDGLYLQKVSSFAWATCGAASYINTASTDGVASLLITRDRQILITNNIEAPRLEKEELLVAQGWEFHVGAWHASQMDVVEISRGLRLAADGIFPGALDISIDLAHLRANLTPEEVTRFQDLGKDCARSMDAAARAVLPGQTEFEISARLAAEAELLGMQAIVNLVATDERIYSFRHPLPTGKKLKKYAMLILCGRRHGLVCSLTRLVHFGPLPNDLQHKVVACAQVDAAFIVSTRPGQNLGTIFNKAVATYALTGFPDEWRKHHQGGAAGYEPREYLAVPGSPDVVKANQVYAWNPSITGCKSEDTILVGETQNEILTGIQDWPVMIIDGLARPSILAL
jgi:Xaa-Pro aminopeptidase